MTTQVLSAVEVLEVSQAPLDARLLGAYVDEPAAGAGVTTYSLAVGGWAVGRESAVTAVEVLDRGELLARVPTELARADVAAALGDANGAARSGFRALVGVLGTPEQAELDVQAVLADGGRAPIGVIRLRTSSLAAVEAGVNPLLITTLGRTGSTWLARLLGQHPAIVAYRPFQYELRVASYWAEVLKVLTRPSSYLQPLVGRDKVRLGWWLGEKEIGRGRLVPDPDLQHWVDDESVGAAAAFCRSRMEAFYEEVARLEGKENAAYFAEKILPSSLPNLVQQLFPETREVFLVRDFRDRLCSVFAYNEQRGGKDFGARSATTAAEHVERMRRDGMQLLESWRSRSARAHLVRYEDLVRQPHQTLTALLEYLGVDSSTSTVEQIVRRGSADTSEMERHRTAPDTNASVGRWRVDLDPELRRACNEAFAELLSAFGYDTFDFDGFDGDLCPPRELMNVGGGDFSKVGEEFLRYFVDLAGLRPNERVLDVGCGIGRMAVPLTRYLDETGSYEGFDVVPRSIAWCEEHITARYPNFRFQLADIRNGKYNPSGALQACDYRFPYDDSAFDFVFLTSIFTHMLPADVEQYMAEIARVLKPGGRMLASFYLLNEESLRLQENRSSRIRFRREQGPCRVSRADVPEAVVAYREDFVLDVLARSGLVLEQPVHYGSWPGREQFLSSQDVVRARKP
jgi:SAM-dependent methyltransferase